MIDFNPEENCILKGYRGSIAHNLYIPPEEEMSTDDIDIMGVCIPPISCYFGIDKFEHLDTIREDNDIVIYELRKFVRLLMKSNPNVLGFLWNEPEMFLEMKPEGKLLVDNRELFSSQAAYYSFMGYANGQLNKMHKDKYNGYMGAKRKEIVDKFGFDTKMASHLIRLLRMGNEFLLTQRLNVYREKDREELIAIKRGKWSLDKIKNEANRLFKEAHELKTKTKLPEVPNYEKINNLCIEILNSYFGRVCHCKKINNIL